MGDRNKITFLLLLATGLTFALFGFVAINYSDYHHQLEIAPETSWACGTAALESKHESLLSPAAVTGKEVFKQNCKACHRMKEKLVGPALTGVFERRDSVWIRKMIVNAEQLRKRGDKQAIILYREYGQLEHTRFTSMNEPTLDALLSYLKEEY